LDRSLAATIARTGGRLAAVLLPLAAFAVLHALSFAQKGTPLPWVEPGIAWTAALAAGLALLVAVAATVEKGRARDAGDAAGLGMLAVTFAVVAMRAAGGLGLGIGVASAAAAFAVGSATAGRLLPDRRGRVIGIVVVLVLVEACLAAVLISGSPTDDRLAPLLLGGAAVMLAIAAAGSLNEATRATGLGIAASATAALALAGPSDSERLVGAAAVAMAAAVLAWSLLVHRLRRAPTALPELAPANAPDRVAEPEFDESARLTRELRATLDDLVAARRTISLQRAEIERASTFDPLTGLPSRGPTLDRLRTEAAEARRYAHPVTVVLLDIDGFAALNHDYGLSVGDAILREVALRLRLRIREADALGRVGGDSFLATLPHTDEEGAATFAQALLERLVSRPFTTDRGEMTVSLSLGIALMRPGMTLSGEELLAAAEEALASAKAAGGNRIAFDRLHGLARLDEHRGPQRGPDRAEATGEEQRNS
jgi:diguanylate cyclase (GGDEF)-like protein